MRVRGDLFVLRTDRASTKVHKRNNPRFNRVGLR
jgi:hypothetical protein